MADLLYIALTFLMALAFAAVWGAHLIETIGLFQVWAEDPATAVPAFVASPYMAKLANFWRRVVPALYTLSLIALITAVVAGIQSRLALAIAGACGLIHLAMIILIFLPTNKKIGFYSGAPVSLDPQTLATLVRTWGRWNLVRIGVETIGLVSALLAFRTA